MRKADYDFSQLSQWRDMLRSLLTEERVFSLDIDETVNKLRIGVENRTAVEWVEAAVSAAGVPTHALLVDVQPRPMARTTLQQWVRPIDGGYQIQLENGGYCTMGFNALLSGQQVFVTASHCSQLWFSNPDNSLQHQPTDNSPSYAIGREVNDRTFYMCDGIPSVCRWSDAAVFAYNPGVNFERGYIARTVEVVYGQDGSLVVDGSDPRFEINATNPYGLYVGWRVDKVGRTSGWTRGTLLQSCVDLASAAGPPLHCQMVADLWSRRGDSGSPIFTTTRHRYPTPDYVVLFGVLWGGPGEDWTTTYYSPFGGVEADLGTFVVTPEPAPPPLSVSIEGPTEVQPGAYCNWWANVSGGDSPYDYDWSGVLSGSQLWVSGALYSSGWLNLDVSDDASPPAHGDDSIYVTVSWNAPVCFEDDVDDKDH